MKEPAPISQEEWDGLVGSWKMAKPKQKYIAVGCQECRHTGYRGRSGIYEMLAVSNELKRRILPNTDLAELRAQAYKDGMQPLIINGAEKIAAGLTTIEELLKVAPPLEQDDI